MFFTKTGQTRVIVMSGQIVLIQISGSTLYAIPSASFKMQYSVVKPPFSNFSVITVNFSADFLGFLQ